MAARRSANPLSAPPSVRRRAERGAFRAAAPPLFAEGLSSDARSAAISARRCAALGDATGAFGEVPQALKPLSNLSVVKWSFEGVLASEFENLTFDKNDVETNSSKQLRLRAEKKKREKSSHSIVYDATKWATSKLESIGPERGEDVLEEFGLKAKGQARDAAKGQFAVFLFNVALAFTALTLKEKQ